MKKKTKLVIIGLSVVALIAVIVICFMVKDKNGIKVDGKMYTFSAENGIDNYEKINDGVVLLNGIQFKYFAEGSSKWVESTDVYSNYFQPRIAKAVGSDGYEMGSMQFIFGEDYLIDKTIGPDSESNDIEAKGYYSKNNGKIYTLFATEGGNIDWKDAEADYNKAKEDGTFKKLEYYEVLKSVSPEVVKFNLDDFSETEKAYKNIGSQDVKKDILMQLSFARLCYQLSKGEIDYFVTKEIIVGDTNSLAVIIYADQENVDKWIENWGAVGVE